MSRESGRGVDRLTDWISRSNRPSHRSNPALLLEALFIIIVLLAFKGISHGLGGRHSMRRMLAFCLCALITSVASSAVEAATITQLDRARDQGLAWLLIDQNGDGSWRGAQGVESVVTASAADALAVAGLKGRAYV